MPLSRLSPRSARTGLARQRFSSANQAGNQRHLQLWAAIRKTREELDLLQRQIDQVETLFNQHIVPRERDLTDAMSAVTKRLIQHFSETNLDIPNQSLLGLWINENLNSLQDHPFGNPDDVRLLNKQWLELLNNDGPVEVQLARLARRINSSSVSAHDAKGKSTYDVDAADESAVSQTYEHPSDTFSKSDKQSDSPDHSEDKTAYTDAESEKQKFDNDSVNTNTADKLQSLEDKLSVEHLFRQLAKVLHPDREQNDARRAEKHILMSQCLKARQEKDINALLSLYCEHVGELPDELDSNSHSELISALEAQLKELQTELRQRRFGDPLQSMIVERYSSSDNADCNHRIQSHAQSLNIETTQARQLVRQLDDYEGLLDALDERRSVEQDRMAINELTGLSGS